MLLRKLVVVGLVGFVSFAANIATAEDAVSPSSSGYAVEGVDLTDPAQALSNRFQVSTDNEQGRFSSLAPAEPAFGRRSDRRGYELQFISPGLSGLNVSFAQRGGLAFNDDGDIERETQASELRLGRGLNSERSDRPSAEPRWYFFAASEDEALTWGPGARNEFGGSGSSFALQDRAEIGDIHVCRTYFDGKQVYTNRDAQEIHVQAPRA